MNTKDANEALTRALEISNRAHAELQRAQLEWKLARRAEVWAEAQARLSERALTAAELGEMVADAAREHGAESAKEGFPADATWANFRVMLLALVQRAEGASDDQGRRV